MKKIIFNLVFNRTNKVNKKGMALIQVEAYLNGKKTYFSTHVYLKPEQWDYQKRIIKKHPNKDELNTMIRNFVAELEALELKLRKHNAVFSLNILKETYKKTSGNSFISFMRTEIERSSLQESTRRNHLSTLKLLIEFAPDVEVLHITYDFLLSFEDFLRRKNHRVNTIAKHMKHIKRYINIATNKDLLSIQDYAFRKYRIKTEDYRHKSLNPAELSKLEQLTFDKRHTPLEQILDAFLFCCYTGLRYSDFINISPQCLVTVGNDVWLIFNSVKTKAEVRLPLNLLFEEKPLRIINKYKDDLEAFFRLKDNSSVNKQLIQIKKHANLQTHFSFHTARHTNATLLIYKGANITTVQKLLGHKSVKTTQVYSNILDMTIVNDLKNLRGM